MTLRKLAHSGPRKVRAVSGAISTAMISVLMLAGTTAAPAAADTTSTQTYRTDIVHVCQDESLNLIRADGTRLGGIDLARAISAIRD
ncbi:hypothetical protein GCM10009819_02580 [Agromyces tropicus]|uniref:Uncharacterized protein n=1 Tax=Agromyces tropicus TaxID=555371 RepID=A0ABN2TXA1_9MICO